MADIREIFTILEDATGAGQGYEGKAPGGAQSTDVQAPVLPAVDTAGNLQNIPIRDSGDASAGVDSIPTLPASDTAGNLQRLPIRDEGDTATGQDALPGLVAKDDTNNLTYLNVDSAGKLCVTSAALGTILQDIANTNVGSVGVAVSVAAVAINNSKNYVLEFATASATKAVKWELFKSDNAVETLLDTRISGPGDYNADFQIKIEFASGATGAQSLILKGTQLKGPSTDLYASVSVLEKV